MIAAIASMATSCRDSKQLPAAIRQKSYYMVLESLKTVLQIVEIFHLTLNQLFSKLKHYGKKKDSKAKVTWITRQLHDRV